MMNEEDKDRKEKEGKKAHRLPAVKHDADVRLRFPWA
jgi:hypothetical protein